ncbi:cytochrome P450 [Phakopsora pachyrhizi]|uniref:Cytochrome P450 n=1 Tax=Phakopsora pachyrhizi TaxID=170000 RepID=A0AAV0AM19_PHAPC|nr:cytochrome P450 [Phakopsora pachyrhizi]CAH7669593.1 cytochrome P450 [Phakopsora pachyrhizi]
MSSFRGTSSVEQPFPLIHLLSHFIPSIFLTHPFNSESFLINTRSSSLNFVEERLKLALRREIERYYSRELCFYTIIILLICLFIYDALRPRPLNGIPTSGQYVWALGDSGALYRHMRINKTRTTFFVDQSKRVGPLSQVMIGPAGTWFGKLTGLGSHIVVVADGRQLVEICSKRASDFPDPGMTLEIYRGIIPHGQLALSTGPQFKHHRKAISPSISTKHLSKVTPKITNSVNELIKLWKHRSQILSESGESYFKAAQDLRLSTMDTISDIIFGKPFGVTSARVEHICSTAGAQSADSRPQFPALARYLNIIVAEVARCYIAPSKPLFWFTQKVFNRKLSKAKSQVFEFLKREVEVERQAQAEEKIYEADGFGNYLNSKDHDKVDSVLSLLVRDEELSKSRGQSPLSMEEITQELLVYWVAGHGTMACTLAWGVKFLSNHPEVQLKLRDQLLSVLPSSSERPPTFSDFAKLSSELGYLDATCYEILRCAKTLGEVSRKAGKDTSIMGHLIPKDTMIMMPHGFLGDEASNAKKLSSISSQLFSPERWLDARGQFDSQRLGTLHIFGHGPRGCFGKSLAILELKLYVAMLSMEFFFDKVPEEVNSMESVEFVANHPQMCVVRPILWSQWKEEA